MKCSQTRCLYKWRSDRYAYMKMSEEMQCKNLPCFLAESILKSSGNSSKSVEWQCCVYFIHLLVIQLWSQPSEARNRCGNSINFKLQVACWPQLEVILGNEVLALGKMDWTAEVETAMFSSKVFGGRNLMAVTSKMDSSLISTGSSLFSLDIPTHAEGLVCLFAKWLENCCKF